MFWLDWILIWIPLAMVVWIALKSQRYVKGVADFLAAGRVGGRYVICVASGEAAMGLISAVAIMEMYYQCGFAISFWSTLTAPISLIMGLTGFCIYRFRETRALTMGQFFEMRYSRSLRTTAAVIQSISGIVN
ncbi:MAG: sodium:panthothenate symporter, partial [Oligosphaeraceae bacterium]|nr:sodium:panthothenate symporter [Oligosphaeraceae bacterium]